MRPVILASASPRRRELMALLGVEFTIHPSLAAETIWPGDTPEQSAQRLARQKAADVYNRLGPPPDVVMIGCDTVVELDGHALGKPEDTQQAVDMLTTLSGRAHRVITAVCLMDGSGEQVFSETTTVFFRPLSRREIDRYVQTGEPMDKAGAYGIQGGAAAFVQRIEGDFYNVVGLPVCRLLTTLMDWETRPDTR